MVIPQKSWASFEEMYLDLKDNPSFKESLTKGLFADIDKLIKDIELSKNSKDFFNNTCKLSSIFESLNNNDCAEICSKTNVYVLVLNAVFKNTNFTETVIELVNKNRNISDLKKDRSCLDKLIFLNTGLSLAFFGIAINYHSISKQSIEFLRKNTTDLVKYAIIRFSGQNIIFTDLCYFLERIAWDNRLHYNENYDSKFPIKLKDEFLFSNLRSSRSFAGVTFTSLVIRPAIEARFKNVINNFNNKDFSISKALDSIFYTTNELREKIIHYYRNAPKDIADFFDVFIKNNEKNLIYCIRNFCADFHFQEEKRFYEIILEKLETVPGLKHDFIDYMKKNFVAFNKQSEIDRGYDEWTNKLFLISIKTLSLLEEIKGASDSKWLVSVSVYEFRQWILDVHEVLNKYYIEDDWDKVKDLLIQENEKIEWKSTFFTPLEQEYRDEISDSAISKKLFGKIVKTILGMINTDGGVLIVGVIENPGNITRLGIEEFLLKKNQLSFFDVSGELKKRNKTLDSVRIEILDSLKQITDNSADNFNGLIEFEPVNLRDDNHVITIIKIVIKKGEKIFFNIRKEENLVWLSLTKRAQGQTIDVDVRNYITKNKD